MKSISIAAPVYNEELNIENCVSTWLDVLNELQIIDYEIVLCDDKSTDNSIEIINKLIKSNSNIKLVRHQINQGAAKAVISAGNSSTKERVLFVDSDGQFPKESIKAIIDTSNKNPNITIFGARTTKEDSFLTQLGTKMTTILFNIIYQKNLTDISCILKIYPKDIYQSLFLESTGLNVSTEMSCRTLELGCPIIEQRVAHRLREFGTSSAAGIRFIKHGFKRIAILKYFMYRRILIAMNILSVNSSK